MVLNLITFASLLHKQASILGSHELILNELEKYFTVNIVEYQNINKLTKDDFSLLFIATGGVERLVIQHFESLPRPASYWRMVCKTRLPLPSKFRPGYVAGV